MITKSKFQVGDKFIIDDKCDGKLQGLEINTVYTVKSVLKPPTLNFFGDNLSGVEYLTVEENENTLPLISTFAIKVEGYMLQLYNPSTTLDQITFWENIISSLKTELQSCNKTKQRNNLMDALINANLRLNKEKSELMSI